MGFHRLKIFNRQFSFSVFSILSILWMSLTLAGCGKGEHSASDGLQISLSVPSEEIPNLFWLGVDNKWIKLERNGQLVKEWRWSEGTQQRVELEENDVLRFEGRDSDLRVLVQGEAKVPSEKKVTIPLKRNL